ncbi:MAG TPA: polymer-forming cytoskeletal protein [Anaerolineales bacterium]|jgi:hypothetical protein
MNKMNKLLGIVLLLCLLLLPMGSVHAEGLAEGLNEGKVIFGDDFTLEKGETLEGDLAVFGGDVTIEEGATVNGSVAVIGGQASLAADAEINGDVAIIGGTLDVEGSILGDVAVVGGQITLGETALVDGDIAKIGAQLDQAPGATITGSVVDNPAPSINIPDQPVIPNAPNGGVPEIHIDGNPLWQFGGVFLQALLVGFVAILATLFLHPQLERVGQTITAQPLIAGSFGLLTVVIVPVAALILVVTLILIPVSFLLVAVILPLAWLFGLLAIGLEVGDRLARALNQRWAPALMAGSGAFLLMLVSGYIGLIPCVGWLLPFLIGLLGVGGTALTVFGTRAYPRPAAPT